jgi:hypothetical protein
MSFEREELSAQIPTSVESLASGAQKKSKINIGTKRLKFMSKGIV